MTNATEAALIALIQATGRYPDQRICQIIVNATERDDPFHVPDTRLLEALTEYNAEAGP